MIKRFLASTLAGGLLVAGAIVGSGSTPAGATECPDGSWTDTVGRPAEAVSGMTGAALFRLADNDHYRLRVSEAGRDRAVFTGTITTDGALVFGRRHLEGGDLTVRRDGNRVVFRFTNYGGVDGLDFGLRCASTLRVSIKMDGEPLATDLVVIGGDSAHPDTNPFVIRKTVATV